MSKHLWKRQGRSRRKGIARTTIGKLEALERKELLAADLCVNDLLHDSTGAYFFDASPHDLPVDAMPAPTESGVLEPPPVGIRHVPIYHSRPSAQKKIYLDFNGQNVSGTGWNDSHKGRLIEAPAFDVDGDDDTFSYSEQQSIERIWTRVSEDFAPFDIDVTTDPPPSSAFRKGSQAIRVLISSNIDRRTGERWFDNAGGVAYLDSWQWESDTPVWVFEDNLGGREKRIAEAISHEVGHAFGLEHDAIRESDAYFRGYGSGPTSWAPIMGSGFGKSVTQWSRGEYEDANNTEDDLSIIVSPENDIRYVEDDHSSTFTFATRMQPNAAQEIELGGLISRNSDQDMFVFEIGAAEIDLEIKGARHGSNLDIEATLFDGKGNRIEKFNPSGALSAPVKTELPAGEYYLLIDGVGKGDPNGDGYSDYGSMGAYTISGSVRKLEVIPPGNGTSTTAGRSSRAITMARQISRSPPRTHIAAIRAALTSAASPSSAIVKVRQIGTFQQKTRIAAIRAALLAALKEAQEQQRQQALLGYLEEADQALGWN